MNPYSGAIAKFEKHADAIKAGFTVPLTEKQAAGLLPMNLRQRRAWASEQRKKPTTPRGEKGAGG